MYLLYTQFYFKYDDFEMTTFLFQRIPTIVFLFMAIWSYRVAMKGNDPGFIDWEHFRTTQMLSDEDDKVKWNDVEYRKKKANMKLDDAEDSMGAVKST